MSQLVCIIGPDGAGKSTQINLLINNLKEKGINYEYRWLRFHHFFSLPLLGLARLLNLSEIKTINNHQKIGYHYFYRSKVISNLYPVLLFLDTFIFTIIKIYIPMKASNKNLACDRFIYDTLIDLMISTKNYNIYKSTLGKLYLNLIPNDIAIFMLMTDITTLKNRRMDIMHDKFLSSKINLYRELAHNFKIPVINADLSIEKIHEELIKTLLKVNNITS